MLLGHHAQHHSLVYFRPVHPLGESAGGHFPVADDQHGSTIRPYVWLVPPASPPYPMPVKELVFDNRVQRFGGLIGNYQSLRG